MEAREILANNVRMIRERLNYSQQDIAGFLSISQAAYSKFESADLIPSVDVIKKLATLYNIDEYVFYEEKQDAFITELAFAFRANEIAPEDLQQIARFNKIVRNYLNMCYELEKEQSA